MFTIAALPITLGLLAYAALGPAAAGIGIPAAFVTAGIGAVVVALLSGARMPAFGPTSATALILAALVTELARAPGLDPAQPGALLAGVVAPAAAAVALMGLLLAGFGLARLGSLISYVPRPVLSGFMNGVAVVIVLSQLPTVAGVPAAAWYAEGWRALAAAQPATLAVAGFTLALVVALQRWRPQWPALLLALAAGALAYHGLARALPQAALGGTVGPLPAGLPPLVLAPLLHGAGTALLPHAATVAATGLVLAVIGALESLLNVAAVDLQTGHLTDPNRDLRTLGLANLATAAFGGLPGVQVRVRAMSTLQLGGRTRRAALVGALGAVALLVAALPLLAPLPHVVPAALMVAIAGALVDGWSLQLLRRWRAGDAAPGLLGNLLVMAAVMLATIFAGFAAAVGFGVLASMALVIRAMNRALVRDRWTGPARPSRRVYLAPQEAVLTTARAAIEGVEVEGALFFGSVERLAGELRELRPQTRYLVLDLRRVSTLEASGVVLLGRLQQQLQQRGAMLLLAGLRTGPAQALRAFGSAALLAASHLDADRAVEAAEHALLAAAGAALEPAVPLAQALLLQGLDEGQRQRVCALLVPRRLAGGERLFAEGSPGDSLYVVGQGSIAIVAAAGDAPQRRVPQRFLCVSPGMMLGEIALLDGAGRSAEAVAEVDSLVHRLDAAALARLGVEDPALAAALYRNIAVHLSQRLRSAANAWRDHAA